MTYSLRNVSSGYAEIVNENGRRVGTVSKDIFAGSGRTSFIWRAYRSGQRIGYGYTRAEAVAVVTAAADEHAAKLDAILGR